MSEHQDDNPIEAPEPRTTEQRQEKDDTKTRHFRNSVIAFVVVIALAFAGFAAIAVREGSFSRELRDGLVENCKTNGNKLRSAVQGIYIEKKEQAEDPTLFKRLFPFLSDAELEELTNEAIEMDEETAAKVAPLNCESQYPKK